MSKKYKSNFNRNQNWTLDDVDDMFKIKSPLVIFSKAFKMKYFLNTWMKKFFFWTLGFFVLKFSLNSRFQLTQSSRKRFAPKLLRTPFHAFQTRSNTFRSILNSSPPLTSIQDWLCFRHFQVQESLLSESIEFLNHSDPEPE